MAVHGKISDAWEMRCARISRKAQDDSKAVAMSSCPGSDAARLQRWQRISQQRSGEASESHLPAVGPSNEQSINSAVHEASLEETMMFSSACMEEQRLAFVTDSLQSWRAFDSIESSFWPEHQGEGEASHPSTTVGMEVWPPMPAFDFNTCSA
eukprot:CAMPEP_0178390126 /NCGR_PEP_ID=MMETSP0689_2-20121128/10483_1 /TAXON_ID=160604 /ORGANISM="Amphidinium massartii, Strain CS-259" /LENGTH=152 /DNA_ID=CAMNT_0020010621 /DNA_START=15 /DNA_END=473 /DNA_ORIENTATION=-